MALADIPSGGPPRRLDSWKEIAEYLRRDVRTATRWESQGLPLHRVAGGKGRSVFAFTNEIDAWMASHPAELQAEVVVIQPLAAPVALEPEASPRSLRTIAISAVCAIVLIGIGAVVMSSGGGTPIYQLRPEVTGTASHIAIADASGVSRVIYQFDRGAMQGNDYPGVQLEDINADGAPEILASVPAYETGAGREYRSGELLNLSTDGAVRWRFGFDDALTFAGRSVSSPWMVTDWHVEPDTSPKRIAITAHEERWWASIVALLDSSGRRLGSFVNPGWIESVLWRSPDRLAIAGSNNMRGEGMFAMLDASRLGGQAPGSTGTDYACLTCTSTLPLFYATFPRSELNIVTAQRPNRGSLATIGDRLEVSTREIGASVGGGAIAVYEFDRDLRFLTARYSDNYWDEHVRLEREGRLTHSRGQCPERDGPAAIHVWDAARGWVRTTPLGGS